MVNKTILKLLVFVLNGCSMVQIVSFNIVNSCGICITSTRGEDSNRISSKKEKKGFKCEHFAESTKKPPVCGKLNAINSEYNNK